MFCKHSLLLQVLEVLFLPMLPSHHLPSLLIYHLESLTCQSAISSVNLNGGKGIGEAIVGMIKHFWKGEVAERHISKGGE